MKTPKQENKLVLTLKKRTISNLNERLMAQIVGGTELSQANNSLLQCSVTCSPCSEECSIPTTRDRGIPPAY